MTIPTSTSVGSVPTVQKGGHPAVTCTPDMPAHACDSPDHCTICDENAIAYQVHRLNRLDGNAPRTASLIRDCLATLSRPGYCACGCDMEEVMPG